MSSSLKKLITEVYANTNGYMPVMPFEMQMNIGDFFLIERGRFVKLGSLVGNESFFGLEENVQISTDYNLSNQPWQIENNIKTSFKSIGAALEWENIYITEDQQSLIVNFLNESSFFMKCGNLTKHSFRNFALLQFQLIQKMVTETFNFKELFVVTDLVTTNERVIVTASDYGNIAFNFSEEGYYKLNDLVDPAIDFSPLQSKNVAYSQVNGEQACFIKASKLGLSYEGQSKLGTFIERSLPDNFMENYEDLINYGKASLLSSNEIYPANSHDFYSFSPLTLSDLEKLF